MGIFWGHVVKNLKDTHFIDWRNWMGKERMKVCSILLCLAVLLCGCQEAPKEVQERMDRYGDNKQVNTEELRRCTVEELKTTKVSDLQIDLDNMTLPEDVDFSQIESIAVLDLAYEDAFTDNRDKYIKMFNIDESTIHVNNHGAGKTDLYESDDASAKKYFAIENSGFISYISGMTYAYIKDEVKKVDTVETYEVGRDDLSQKSVAFEQEEVPLADMISAAESWLEKNMPLDPFDYRISDVYVRDLKFSKANKKQLSLSAYIVYGGILLDPYTASFDDDTGKVSMSQTGVNMDYDSRDKLTFFSNGHGRIKINAAEQVTEVIDLESAVRLVNDKLASFHELKVSKLLPLYALYPKYQTEETAFASPGQKVEGRPVYAFLINMDKEGPSEFGIRRSAEHYVYVDMVTGEITTDFEMDEDDK